MATYKEIKGTQIEVLSSDPSNPVEGQVWYNSTSNVLKGSIRTGAAAWATANAMGTGRWGGGASSVSPQSDAIMASGANTANVELYNGTILGNEKIKGKGKSCIPGGIRTRDLWIRSPTRYPLRYGDFASKIVESLIRHQFLLCFCFTLQ